MVRIFKQAAKRTETRSWPIAFDNLVRQGQPAPHGPPQENLNLRGT